MTLRVFSTDHYGGRWRTAYTFHSSIMCSYASCRSLISRNRRNTSLRGNKYAGRTALFWRSRWCIIYIIYIYTRALNHKSAIKNKTPNRRGFARWKSTAFKRLNYPRYGWYVKSKSAPLFVIQNNLFRIVITPTVVVHYKSRWRTPVIYLFNNGHHFSRQPEPVKILRIH